MSKYQPWKSFEREIVRKLRAIGFDTKRNWSAQFIRRDGADIEATDGFHEVIVQLKYGKTPNMKQAYKEAQHATRKKNQIAMGVVRFADTRDTLVIMSWKGLEDFLSLG